MRVVVACTVAARVTPFDMAKFAPRAVVVVLASFAYSAHAAENEQPLVVIRPITIASWLGAGFEPAPLPLNHHGLIDTRDSSCVRATADGALTLPLDGREELGAADSFDPGPVVAGETLDISCTSDE